MPSELDQINAELAKRGELEAINAELAKRQDVHKSGYGDALNQLKAAIQKDGQYQVGGPVMGNMEATVKGTASLAEPLMTMATGAAAEPVAGVVGLATAPFVGADKAAGYIDATRDRFTYEPRMDESKENLQSLGEFAQPVIEPIAKGIQSGADFVYEGTGSELAGSLAKAAPAAVMEYLGFKGVGRLMGGTRLLKAGKPTKELAKILNKKGLTFNDLTPEARRAIPEYADRRLLISQDKKVASQVQEQQLVTGGRDNALAPYEMVNGKIKSNAMFTNAISKGWREGTVQMVKTANQQTKDIMRKMLDMRWRLLKSDTNAGKLFPLNAVGDSFNERILFITGKAKQARKDLEQIAQRLKGKPMNTRGVEDHFYSMLDDMDVTYTINPNTGVPKINYKGSFIQADKTSQRAINQAMELMTTGGSVDGYRFHVLKRQLDSLIDFKKKSKDGLTEKGRSFLKGLRHKLNQELRDNFDDYGEVNDVLSGSLDAMDDFKKATGVDVNFLSDPGPSIGQEMRKLHTNYKKRGEIAQAAQKIDDLANGLGGNFNSSYSDLAQFANRMDEVFGASKSGSFQGLQEVGMAYATEGGPGAIRATGRAAKDAYNKVKSSDLFPAYQSMNDILR